MYNKKLDKIMMDIKSSDTSFREKSFLFPIKYNQSEVRNIWFQAIEHGIEKGLFMASLEGQKIDIEANLKNNRHKEFYEKFCKLAVEYECQIQYHPLHGMCVIDRNYKL